MPEKENNIPKEAQQFKAPEDQAESSPESAASARQKRILEFQKLQQEATTEKERRWFEIREQIEHIADGLGKGIDADIKEGVAAFMALDFPTNQSCDGHGVTGPWIEVYAPEPEGWRDSPQKKEEWRQANAIEKVKMSKLLQEFYQNRQVPDEVRLVLDPIGAFEAFRVQSAGYVGIHESNSQNIELDLVRQFREEMKHFTDFLKEKYFTEKTSV